MVPKTVRTAGVLRLTDQHWSSQMNLTQSVTETVLEWLHALIWERWPNLCQGAPPPLLVPVLLFHTAYKEFSIKFPYNTVLNASTWKN